MIFRIAKNSKSIDRIEIESLVQSFHRDVSVQSLHFDFFFRIVNVLKSESMIEMIRDQIIQNFDRNHVYVC